MTHERRISGKEASTAPARPAGQANHRFWTFLGAATLVVILGTSANAQSRTIFPHVPLGGEVDGSIILSNPHLDEPVTGILSFREASGRPRQVVLTDFTCGVLKYFSGCTQIPIFIAPGGTRVVRGQMGGKLSLGSAVLESNLPVSGFYRFRSGGLHLRLSAHAPSESAAFHLEAENGTDVGFVVANAGEDDLWIDLFLVDGWGRIRETISPKDLNPLPARAHYSRLISELDLTEASNRSGWSVQLRSMQGGEFSIVAAVVENSSFSSLPVITELLEREFPQNPADGDQ